jgi:SNF2 family DNA or RNA helicase
MYDFASHAHTYQRNGAAHLWNSSAHGGVATLWLDPGYGKTMIVLHAFKALYDAGIVETMLIVAPLRVAQTVWAQEIEEWASLKGLVACRLHGTKKEKRLERRDVNIWIINYEGIPWFAQKCKTGEIDRLDVVVFDEVRRMKNAQGKRFKLARPIVALAKFKWGLTGTPASNGLMDLFGQFLILDDGLALGKYITKYRASYFEQGYDGFSWNPRPGAQDMIEERIQTYVYRADGFLDLPEFVNDIRKVPMPANAQKAYKAMKRDLIIKLEESGDKITAANAAVLVGKLKQMANGRVYDEDRKIIHVHEAKKEALTELLEELGDEQLLIAYEFNHDLDQLREILGEDIPYLGAGVNEKTALDYVARWNSKDIKIMCAHPASAGHGLNLQKGNAHHILWWGPTVDLDHYIQFNRRLLRQGNVASHVVVHTFVAEATVDESVIVTRETKDGLQAGLLSALTAEFGDSIVNAEETSTNEDQSMTDLAFKSDANMAPAANPFAQQQQGQVANPFAQQQQQPVQQQPVQQQPVQQTENPNPFAGAAGANPFAQQNVPQNAQFVQQTVQEPSQVQNIQQDVAHAPVPQPDPASAPPNPFAGNQTVQDAEVVQTTVAPEETGPEVAVAPQAPAAYADATLVSRLSIDIPLDKMDKVLAAIGRAMK